MNEDLKIWSELEEARSVIKDMDKNVTLIKDSLSNLKYIKDNEFSLSGSKVLVDEICFGNICSLIGTPSRFVEKCNVPLRKMIFDQFAVDKDEMQFVKIEDELVDILAGEFPFFTFTELFDLVAEIIPGKRKVQAFTSPQMIVFNFVTYDNPKAIKVNDDILRGVTVEIATPGYSRYVSVGTFTLREVCTNGLIARSSKVSRIKSLAKEQLFDRTRELVKSAFLQESDRLMNDFVELKDHRIEDPVGYVSRLSRVEGFGRIDDTLSDELLTLDDQSAFEVINRITSYANRMGVTFGRRLQNMAGAFTSSHITRCPRCFSRLR